LGQQEVHIDEPVEPAVDGGKQGDFVGEGVGQMLFSFHGFGAGILDVEHDIGLDDVCVDVAERGIDEGVDDDTGVAGPGVDGNTKEDEIGVGSPAVKGVVVVVLVDPANEARDEDHPGGDGAATKESRDHCFLLSCSF